MRSYRFNIQTIPYSRLNMYSVNQDYFGLSEFLRNERKEEAYPGLQPLSEFLRSGHKEEVIYPGLKPFNPSSEVMVKPDLGIENMVRNMSLAEVTIVQYVPVFPVDEEKVVAIFQDEEKIFPNEDKITDKIMQNRVSSWWENPRNVTINRNYSNSPCKPIGSRNLQMRNSYLCSQADRKHSLPLRKKVHGCGFCRRNGERESFCMAHTLKDELGKVSCPILRNYKCPQCSASGDDAHTVAYCPRGQNKAPITSIKSPRKSCGCKWSNRHCHCT